MGDLQIKNGKSPSHRYDFTPLLYFYPGGLEGASRELSPAAKV